MDAARRCSIALGLPLALAILFPISTHAATGRARTQNFLVEAPTQALAESVAQGAERYREELAMYWLGNPLPAWPQPCPINVISGPRLAAQGATTYTPHPVGNFRMEVIGSTERILDSVLPHEVTHTVLATHFGRPLPRWADEGICTTVEHAAERDKHERKLREFLSTRRGIAMNRLFLLTEYPQDMLPMYAQGYSVCRFLVEQEGPRRFIQFLEDWMKHQSWTENVKLHYGYQSLAELQEHWLAWVANGSGPVGNYVSARSKANASLASVARSTDTLAMTRREARNQLESIGPGIPQRANSGGSASRQLKSTASGSWYKRRREETALGKIAAIETIPTPQGHRSIAPPSVSESGDYSVSQPQEEISYGQLR